MVSVILSTLITLLVVVAIPFLFYLIRKRQARGFFRYVGLYRPEVRSVQLAVLIVVIIAPLFIWIFSTPGLREIMISPQSTSGQLQQQGRSLSTAIILLITALVQTALAEEIFFRGFLAKRLIGWLGFVWGNTLQALIFGALHILPFVALSSSALSPIQIFAIGVIPTAMGWMLGYINEQRGNGSIVPGWIAHGLTNCIAYAVVVFFWT